MRPGSPRGWIADRPASPAETLAWDATRYLLDDLDPTATAAFERRLGHDQAAREALAAAVDLVGAVVRVGLDPVVLPLHLPVRSRRPRAVWLRRGLVAAAAAILLAVGTTALRPHGSPGSGRPEGWRIAAIWAALHRGELAGALDADPLTAGETPGEAETDTAEVPPERPVPSWMVAAVAVVPPEPTDMGDMGERTDSDETDSLMDEGD